MSPLCTDTASFVRSRIAKVHDEIAIESGGYTTTGVDTVELLPDGGERKSYSFYIRAEQFGHRLAVGDEIDVLVHRHPPGDAIHMIVEWEGRTWTE